MFIFNQGRDPFNKFMTSVLTQNILGGIALIVLYRSTTLAFSFNTLVFYGFTLFIWSLMAAWLYSIFKEFVLIYLDYLSVRLQLNEGTPKFKQVWKHDTKLAIDYLITMILIVGMGVIIFFWSMLSAIQLAETIQLR